MHDAIIVGDGPGGLSAALFLAKAGKSVLVFGQDKTAMHAARLYNYLGIAEISGSDFQRAAREQVARHGATFRDARVTAVASLDGSFVVTTESGEQVRSKYLILSEGKGAPLARSLDLESTGADGMAVDRAGRSSMARVYVVGRSARPARSQAIISAGDGAAAALDILSAEKGQDFCDWDTPPKE